MNTETRAVEHRVWSTEQQRWIYPSEPLELSDMEHVAVRNALSTAQARGYNYNATIDLILEGINRVRAGGEPG